MTKIFIANQKPPKAFKMADNITVIVDANIVIIMVLFVVINLRVNVPSHM